MPTKLSTSSLFVVIGGVFCIANSSVLMAEANEANEANHYIEFYEEWDEDCEEKGGARVFVKNTHQTHIIDLQLDRYFYDVVECLMLNNAGSWLLPVLSVRLLKKNATVTFNKRSGLHNLSA